MKVRSNCSSTLTCYSPKRYVQCGWSVPDKNWNFQKPQRKLNAKNKNTGLNLSLWCVLKKMGVKWWRGGMGVNLGSDDPSISWREWWRNANGSTCFAISRTSNARRIFLPLQVRLQAQLRLLSLFDLQNLNMRRKNQNKNTQKWGIKQQFWLTALRVIDINETKNNISQNIGNSDIHAALTENSNTIPSDKFTNHLTAHRWKE